MTIALKNEQDVREEVATPFLKALGYAIGTPNGIEREHRLRYRALQLGRKKPNDAPLTLGGNVDYLLTVAGAGRWILETKPPDQEITVGDIDQATSYARHPEVSGCYVTLLNGYKFLVYHSSQTSNENPLMTLDVSSPEELARKLEGLLSPAAIRRDCSPPVVDLRLPLAEGYRGEAAIKGGWNKIVSIELEPIPGIPHANLALLREELKKSVGMQSAVRGGRIWRDDASRIRAQVQWHAPHEAMKGFLDAVGLDAFEYVCLNETVSANPLQPSIFEILASYEMRGGQVFYDLLQWKSKTMGFDANFTWQGQAIGYFNGSDFVGHADFRAYVSSKALPFLIVLHFLTEFSFATHS